MPSNEQQVRAKIGLNVGLNSPKIGHLLDVRHEPNTKTIHNSPKIGRLLDVRHEPNTKTIHNSPLEPEANEENVQSLKPKIHHNLQWFLIQHNAL